MVGVSGGVVHGHEATEAVAEHDRVLEVEGDAEPHDVVGPRVEVPAARVVPLVAAPVAAVVEVDDEVGVSEAVEVRTERRVVSPGPPCSSSSVGRSRMRSSVGSSDEPATSKNSFTPPPMSTRTCGA